MPLSIRDAEMVNDVHSTRRQFLAGIAAGAVAAGVLPGARVVRAAPATQPAAALPARSRLISVFDQMVFRSGQIHARTVTDMLNEGLTRLTGGLRPRDAWQSIIRPGQKIAIKFNRCGAGVIGTTPAMAVALIESLATAGFGPGQIMLLDVSGELVRTTGTRPPIVGFRDAPVDVLGRAEHLAAALDWADCLINVPFVKDHFLAGVTCGLKNLSHGLIKTPARWHGDRCRESIPHLFALPDIRGKLRLTVCNALQIVYDGGPEASIETLAQHNRLLLSFDPVAIDAMAARIIDQVRGLRDLKDLNEAGRHPAYLAIAQQLNLGHCETESIDIHEVEP